MKVQFIKDPQGVAQYVVLPIEEYRRLATSHIPMDTDDDSDWEDVEYEQGENDDALIPHEVVSIMVESQVSLLSAWRHYRKLTQTQVKELTGISQANLSQVEKQGNKPQRRTLEKLAKAYDCEVEQLTD